MHGQSFSCTYLPSSDSRGRFKAKICSCFTNCHSATQLSSSSLLKQWFSNFVGPWTILRKNLMEHFAMLPPCIIYCTVKVTVFRHVLQRFYGTLCGPLEILVHLDSIENHCCSIYSCNLFIGNLLVSLY